MELLARRRKRPAWMIRLPAQNVMT